MATKVVKEEVIRVRVDKYFKYRLKKMCKDKKISMSKLIINMLENEVNKYEFKIENEKVIDSRAEETEKKLRKLKEKLKEKQI
ncbi:MAG: Protein CopB [uncultured Clostridium sp.]